MLLNAAHSAAAASAPRRRASAPVLNGSLAARGIASPYLPMEAAEALDWRLNLMQRLLLFGSADLQDRQARAEELARCTCLRWKYQDELHALRVLDANRVAEKLRTGGLLAMMPRTRAKMCWALAALGDNSRRPSIAAALKLFRHTERRRALRKLRRAWLAAAARAASAPPTLAVEAFRARAAASALRAWLDDWRCLAFSLRRCHEFMERKVAAAASRKHLAYSYALRTLRTRAVDATRRRLQSEGVAGALRQRRCTDVFGVFRRGASCARAMQLATTRRQLRLHVRQHWRSWHRCARRPAVELRLRHLLIEMRLARTWRMWRRRTDAGRLQQMHHAAWVARALIQLVDVAWNRWATQAAAGAKCAAAARAVVRGVVHRWHLALLEEATRCWQDVAISSSCRRRLVQQHLAKQSSRSRSRWLETWRAAAKLYATLSPLRRQFARASSHVQLAAWRRWVRRWGLAHAQMACYLALINRVGRHSARGAVGVWRRESERLIAERFRLDFGVRTIAARVAVRQLWAWRRWMVEASACSIRLACMRRTALTLQMRMVWRRWIRGARAITTGMALASACADAAEARRRAAVCTVVHRLHRRAAARRHLANVNEASSRVNAIRRWGTNACAGAHAELLKQTSAARGRRKRLHALLETWVSLHVRTTHAASAMAHMRPRLLRLDVASAFRAWRGCWMHTRVHLMALTAATRRWSAKTALALANSAILVAGSRHLHRTRLCRWRACSQHHLMRIAAAAEFGTWRRQRRRAKAFLAWHRRALLSTAHMLVVRRRLQAQRHEAFTCWQAETLDAITATVVAQRSVWRQYQAAFAAWWHSFAVASATSAIVLTSIVPRWRRRCVSMLRVWNALAARANAERLELARGRLVASFRTLRAWLAHERAEFVERLKLRFRVTSMAFHRFCVGCTRLIDAEARFWQAHAAASLRQCQTHLEQWRRRAAALNVSRSLHSAAFSHHAALAWHWWRQCIACAIQRSDVTAHFRHMSVMRAAITIQRRAVLLWRSRAPQLMAARHLEVTLATMRMESAHLVPSQATAFTRTRERAPSVRSAPVEAPDGVQVAIDGGVVSTADLSATAAAGAKAGRRLGPRRGPRATQPPSATVQNRRPLEYSSHARAAWRRWRRTSAALTHVLRFEVSCRASRQHEAVTELVARWVEQWAHRNEEQAKVISFGAARPGFEVHVALCKWRRTAYLLRSSALALARASQSAARTALRNWCNDTRFSAEQRKHLQVQVTECIRCALYRWRHVSEREVVMRTAYAAGMKHADAFLTRLAIGTWCQWLSLERVIASRRLYSQVDSLRALLQRWQDETTDALAMRNAAQRFRQMRTQRSLSPVPWRAIDSACRSASRPGSPPTAPIPTRMPTNLTHSGSLTSASSRASIASFLAAPVAVSVFADPLRKVFARWSTRAMWSAHFDRLGRRQLAMSALTRMHQRAQHQRRVQRSASNLSDLHLVTAQRFALCKWYDAMVMLRACERITMAGSSAAFRRHYARLTTAWGSWLTLRNRRRACASILRASVEIWARSCCRKALNNWLTRTVICAQDAHAFALAAMWQHGTPSTIGISQASNELITTVPRSSEYDVSDMARGFLALDLAGGACGRRALAKWRREARTARRKRVAVIAIRSRRQRQDMRHVWVSLLERSATALIEKMAVQWCSRRAPLRRWRRLASSRRVRRAAAAAAEMHRLHLAWHAWRRQATLRGDEAVLISAIRMAAYSHTFHVAWHTWRQRTLESKQRAAAEELVAARFVQFIQRLLRVCVAQVWGHWRAVAEKGSSTRLMMQLARTRAVRVDCLLSLYAFRAHARARRRRALLRIEARLSLRTRRLARSWHDWIKLITKAQTSACGAQAAALRQVAVLRAALRNWQVFVLSLDRVIRCAGLVLPARFRQHANRVFCTWAAQTSAHKDRLIVLESADRCAAYASRARAFLHWRGETLFSACAKRAISLAFIADLRNATVRWQWHMLRTSQRAQWLATACTDATAAVALRRVSTAWGHWLQLRLGRVPQVLHSTLAQMHANLGNARTRMRQWRRATAEKLRNRYRSMAQFHYGQLAKVRRSYREWTGHVAASRALLSIIRTIAPIRTILLQASWRCWPRQADNCAGSRVSRRWGYALAHTAASEHFRSASLVGAWHRWPRSGYSPAAEEALIERHSRRIRRRWGWEQWRRSMRENWAFFLLSQNKYDALARGALHRRHVAWCTWKQHTLQRRAIEVISSAGEARVMDAALRLCWQRWPRGQLPPMELLARALSHDDAAKMRSAWRVWPRNRVPPRMSMAVAAAHDRVAKLQVALIVWRVTEQASEIVAAQLTLCSHQQLAMAWASLTLALVTQRAATHLLPASVEFSHRRMRARALSRWMRYLMDRGVIAHHTPAQIVYATPSVALLNSAATEVDVAMDVKEDGRLVPEETPSEGGLVATSGFRAGFEAGAQAWAEASVGADAESVAGAAAAWFATATVNLSPSPAASSLVSSHRCFVQSQRNGFDENDQARARLHSLLHWAEAPRVSPSFRRWWRRMAVSRSISTSFAAATYGSRRARLLGALHCLWRHSVSLRQTRNALEAALIFHTRSSQAGALHRLLSVARAPWWRLEKEKVSMHVRNTLRHHASAMLLYWAAVALPIGLSMRVEAHWHSRNVRRRVLLLWCERTATVRALALGYISIAGRVGHRVAHASFAYWRAACRVHLRNRRGGDAIASTRRARILPEVLQQWMFEANKLKSAQLSRWHGAILANAARERQVRLAHDKWRRACIAMATWHGLAHGSYALALRARVTDALRHWRVFSISNMRFTTCKKLAVLAGPGSVQRRLASRLADGFAIWRAVCFEVLPPVVRQLMHVRRRIEESARQERTREEARLDAQGLR